jgi:hypothetical protein
MDAETGEAVAIASRDGRLAELRVDVPARFWRALRLVQTSRLTGDQTLIACFDAGTLSADESIGYGRQYGTKVNDDGLVNGRQGQGVSLTKAYSLLARHHVQREGGKISFQVLISGETSRGVLLQIDRLTVRLDRGNAIVLVDNDALQECELQWAEEPEWTDVEAAWRDKQLTLRIGQQSWAIPLPDGMPLKPQARGLGIVGGRQRAKMATIAFGPVTGAVIDNLVMEK